MGMRGLAAMAVSLLLAPAGARAGISLNGVPIDGVVSQRFENVTVVIDERGNVDILARGYSVRSPGAEAAEPPASAALPPRPPAAGALPPGALTRRYFLVVQQTEPGATEYDVSVFLNGRWVREVRSDGDSDPFEVTRFLKPGANKVTLVATKRVAGVRRSSSRDQRLEVILGEGSAGGGTVVLGTPLVTMTRNAAETETFAEEHDLVAR